MRVLFLTQWFEPEPAFKGEQFADMLVEKGHAVEVATGFPNYPGGKLYEGYRLRLYQRMQTKSGLPLHRLWLYPSHDRSAWGRAANYVSFFVSCLAFMILRGHRYDAVYVYHPPLTPTIAALLARPLGAYRVIIDVQDLWPDSVLVSGMVPQSMGAALAALCRWVYRASDAIVAQSQGMRERLLALDLPHGKVTRIYNWATYREAGPGDAPAVAFQGAGPHIVYGGNIGQAQSLMHVVRAAEKASKSLPGLRLHVFGSGIERDKLESHCRAHPDTVLVLHPSVDRAAMDRIFDEADILILHLKADPLYEFTMPSKAQHYLACGKPIIAGIGGEAAALLEQSGAAIVTRPEDVDAMATAIMRISQLTPEERCELGRRARSFYSATFSADLAMDKTDQVLTAALSLSPAGRLPAAAHDR